jgi:hypothetical protein
MFSIHLSEKKKKNYYLYIIVLRCIFKKSQNISLNFFQFVLLMSKLVLSSGYKSLKV